MTRMFHKSALLLAALSISGMALLAQPTANRNHVVSNTVLQPGITTQAQVDALTVVTRTQAISYVDGLGRPLQTVMTQANPAQKDIISPVEYDNYGREIKKFLPYADLTGSVFGSLRVNAYADQATFYNPSTSSNSVAKDLYPFSQVYMEFSPLSRPLENGAPGLTWQPSNNHTTQPLSLLNAGPDDVKRFTVSFVANSWGSYSLDGVFNAGDLYKTIIKDENGKQVVEFKDREGKILLKKVQLTAADDNGSGSGLAGWLCTYYIYDDFNNLRCVIQPEGVMALQGNGFVFTQTILDEQCFRYEYDARKRMIRKKVPGAGEVYLVYDTRDRLVMTQDAYLRNLNKWLVTVYDNINRPLLSGFMLNTGMANKSFATHLSDAYNSTGYPFTYASQPATAYWEPITENHYDDYSNIPGGLNGSFISTYVNSTNFITTYNAPGSYAQPMTASMQTKGLVTWASKKVLGTSTWLVMVNIYDDDSRVIQVKSQNVTGGTDLITNQYDFSGKIIRSHLAHQKSGANPDIYQVITKTTYDHAGRILNIKKTISSGTITGVEKTIVQNTYDELGQLKTKKLATDYNAGAGL